MPTSDHIARFIGRNASATAASRSTDNANVSEIVVDDTTETLLFGARSGAKTAVDLSNTQTITGNKTLSGTTTFTGATTGLRDSVSVTLADTIAITAAQSGTTFIATKTSATQVFTLPAAATAGLYYAFVCGAGAAGGEVHIGVGTGDNIVAKTHAANDGTGLITTTTTGLLKNTAATNVVGDAISLVSDGVTSWYAVAQTGVWSAT